MTGTSWAALGRVGPERKWRRSLNTTKQTWLLSYAFGEVWGFAKFISSILSWSMRGQRSVVEDYGKESIDELGKFPFTVHRRVGTFILSGKASFVFTGRPDNPVGHPAVCSLHFTTECFTQAFDEKGTRKYLKPGSVPAIRKKNSNHNSERDRRMVGEYLFAVCANITCAVRYTFSHITKRYFTRLSSISSPEPTILLVCAKDRELWPIGFPVQLLLAVETQ